MIIIIFIIIIIIIIINLMRSLNLTPSGIPLGLRMFCDAFLARAIKENNSNQSLIFLVSWVIKGSLGHYFPVGSNCSLCHWLNLRLMETGRSALLRQGYGTTCLSVFAILHK